MSAPDNLEYSSIDNKGMLSVNFIKQSGLRVRLLAGAPDLLELALISLGLRLRGPDSKFEIFEEDGSLFRHYESEPTIETLVNLLHEKFAKTALVSSLSGTEMLYLDHSNDYFMFLGRVADIDEVFHLNRQQMSDYFEDTIEGGGDEIYLRSIWSIYETFM